MAADQNQVLPESGRMARAWDRLVEFGVGMRSKVIVFAEKVWRMGADDPRKAIHAVKVGVALSLVSLFYYTRPFYDKFGSNTMWAVMTVVVVFEYTVGGCLYKVINRGIATLGGGSLALAAHWMAAKSGPKTEPVILGASVFLLAIAATFFRFMPTVKARFDYGVTIFILTFSLVALSGYRVDDLTDLTTERISTIGIGIAITVSVCIFIFPVWSGQELHFLISRNLAKLAESLEGGLEDYFPKNGDSIDRTESASKRSHRYKCVLDSKSSEDSLASLARWEPAHGWFKFRHPWQQYSKRSPECWDKHLRDACMKLNSDSSKVLKELSSSVKTTKKSPSVDLLVGEMKNSVEELQLSLSSLAEASTQPRPAESSELENENSSDVDECDVAVVLMPLTEAMAVVTMASLLIEISARIEGVVEVVAALAELACFKPIGDDKSRSKVQAEEQEAPSMSVVEYTSKFNSLRTYAPTIMVDDTLKLHCFKKGFSSRIQSSLAVYEPTNFADLMEAAIRAEMDIKRREYEGKNKRPLASQSSPSEQRLFGACFNYGKMGYRIMDCREPMKQGVVSNSVAVQNKPKENKPNARVFSMTQKEVDNVSDVVAGLRAEILSESYRVVMPTNKGIETHKLHRSCQEERQTLNFKPRRNHLPWQGQGKEIAPVRISDLESHEEQ
ncbi:hypothetical protein ZIOFF_021861 [Zingiber officinale]|uniref:Aluminum-activated malate transporter n=1 Tax=Zingiber officinale TaxID=94328 RepID=A0A8J5L8V8_ZINOF|nr:hypothetical protein ZIOFF_021861 [Zingiber officinale]